MLRSSSLLPLLDEEFSLLELRGLTVPTMAPPTTTGGGSTAILFLKDRHRILIKGTIHNRELQTNLKA